MTPSSWVRSAVAVCRKDLRAEFRTRASLNALLLFAVSSLVVVSFTVAVLSLEPDVKAALLWVVLFFSAMTGLARSFVHEEETKTVTALRLTAAPEVVFLGKLAANVVLLTLVELVVAPLFLGLLNVHCRNGGLFALVLVLGTIGMAGGATICAALVSKAEGGSALYAVLSLPILLPVLIAAVTATTKALIGVSLTDASAELKLLTAYSGIVITASLMLFEYLWTA